MKEKKKVHELLMIVEAADTDKSIGRQQIGNACKELYKIIEQPIYETYGSHRRDMIYHQLHNTDFSTWLRAEIIRDYFKIYCELYLSDKVQANMTNDKVNMYGIVLTDRCIHDGMVYGRYICPKLFNTNQAAVEYVPEFVQYIMEKYNVINEIAMEVKTIEYEIYSEHNN